MNKFSVGSIESSDLLLELNTASTELTLFNFISGLDDQYLIAELKANFVEFGIPHNGINVFYNGANSWAIKARCQAFKELILQNHDQLHDYTQPSS